MTTYQPETWTINSKEEKDAVREQLERILKHPAFKNSLRSARFLRYVVEYWLLNDHNGELLKERTLGAELFGLDPAYDTNQYTVVRNAASDVRKRIALYYHEPGHEDEIHIEIPAGSYIPSFHSHSKNYSEAAMLLEEDVRSNGEEGRELDEQLLPSPPSKPLWQRSGAFFSLLFMVIVLAICVSVLGWQRWISPSNRPANIQALNLFWQPVLEASPYEPVILVCVEQLPKVAGVDQAAMPVGDALAAADFARLLTLKDKKFHIAVANTVTTEDMQAATVVMVGGIDNPWTSYVTDELRFHFSSQITADSKKVVWIEDRRNPSKRDWSLAVPAPASGDVMDFAIVARVKDPKTDSWRVVASGLDGNGTGVAARLLVDANYTKELTARLPKGWTSKNIEVVIAVKVTNGKVGFPSVVDYEVW